MPNAFGGAELADTTTARLAQSAERKALNLLVVGSSPTVGVFVYWESGQQGRVWEVMYRGLLEETATSPSAQGDNGPCHGCRPSCGEARICFQPLGDNCRTFRLFRNKA